MHIAYPIQLIKAFRSVNIALKLRILTVFLWSYKIVQGWDLVHWFLHILKKQHCSPCSLNLVLLNGKPFTVDLQDSFLLPSKLFSNSHYCTVLRLLQECCPAWYSVACEELQRCPPTSDKGAHHKVSKMLSFFLSLLNWKYPASLNSGLLKGMQYSLVALYCSTVYIPFCFKSLGWLVIA